MKNRHFSWLGILLVFNLGMGLLDQMTEDEPKAEPKEEAVVLAPIMRNYQPGMDSFPFFALDSVGNPVYLTARDVDTLGIYVDTFRFETGNDKYEDGYGEDDYDINDLIWH